ncbi:hypothetical protein SARC_12734 [Sphaeroforma arctica JP610]|uniref:Uncharacterized protein n=1 Tax=Sphaeroforma arctica JP610 TaxID=667725 RepID=A0A0L0FE35_9EUKA|nr:hypothetical protein SARC_12734 [Sphaeroforma arctica JP610]KNC74726.1 hypothetical protein SARC_12734 [Sphaeroforma arctica JP610]|eukprot:XP_014148628.1 hypothetical protein SARC_12734 [Sphaeroforma arctica JP610]
MPYGPGSWGWGPPGALAPCPMKWCSLISNHAYTETAPHGTGPQPCAEEMSPQPRPTRHRPQLHRATQGSEGTVSLVASSSSLVWGLVCLDSD